MGSAQSRKPITVSEEEIRQLTHTTHYDANEVRQLIRQFLTEAPSGSVDHSEFSVVASMTGIHDPEVRDLLFQAFDRNGDGLISVSEFIAGMSVMTRGTTDEKLTFAFYLLDVRRRGYISKNELVSVVASVQRAMMGELVTYQEQQYDSAETFVDALFRDIGVVGNDMSLEQYKIGALRHPSIVLGLSLY